MQLRFFLPLLTTICLLSCHTAQQAQTPAETGPKPAAVPAVAPAPVVPGAFVSWDKKMLDLGKVKKGEKRTLFFEMTNSSAENVQVEIVDACECTRVDFPRGVIAPGGKGRFDVTFDSTEKEADETIGINVVFKNTDAAGNPRIETVEYKFQLEK